MTKLLKLIWNTLRSLNSKFATAYKLIWINITGLLAVTGCSLSNQYYYSPHIPEQKKAAYLHELVYALHINTQSQLLYRLYGNWQYFLTPIDLDNKLDGHCQRDIYRNGRKRPNKELSYYNFFSDVFDQETYILNRKESDCGYELYLEDFINYPKLNDAVHLALIRFQEIAERLEALHFNRQSLLEKYDDIDELTMAIDQDIMSISQAGYKLGQSTKRFFKLAKVQLAMADVANVRSKGIGNLKSFSERIKEVKRTQFNTIEEATMATIKVLEELEADINQ